MDVDEFVTFRREYMPPGPENLHTVLDQNPLPALRMPWMTMGSDGRIEKEWGLTIEHFHHGEGLLPVFSEAGHPYLEPSAR